MLEPALATLAVGIIIGYVGQRSRMCFVGGFRDFLLVRDTELLRGLLAFFVTAWLAFSIASFFGALGSSSTFTAQPSARQVLSGRGLPSGFPLGGNTPATALAASKSRHAGGLDLHASPHSQVTAVGALSITSRLSQWWNSLPYSNTYLALTVLAALGLGLLSVLANGCPFRQHVLAAQGISSSMFYLVGFYAGILLYDRFVEHWLYRMI